MEKIEQIKKGYEILLKKLEELEKFFTEKTFMNEKEESKYFRIDESLNAKGYKEKIEIEKNNFKERFNAELNDLSSENVNAFIKKIVNNYAKIEDGYYALLNTYNNPDMTASVLFRSECLISYLEENLKTVIDNCDKIYDKLDVKSF